MKISKDKINNLEQIAKQIRKDVIKMIHYGQGGHLGGSFSIVEIVTALYFSILNCKPEDPHWEDRDRFILSAGHKCLTLYSALAEKSYFNKNLLSTYDSLDCQF